MGFTTGNDLNIIQPADSAIVGAGAGDDIYVLDSGTIGANQQITISDADGVNTLRLTSGLSITSSLVTSNATQLTLSNGAQVTLLGADSFSFELGGSGLGASPVVQDFNTFALDSLGVSVPGVGEAPSAGGSVEVSEDGSIGNTDNRFTGTSGDDRLTGTSGDDIIRGGAGVDYMDGGVGDDKFIIVGDLSAGGKIDSEEDTGILGFNLTDLNGSNLNEDEDGASETIIGGEGTDTLYVYGSADTTNMAITGIEHIEVRSDVMFSGEFLEVVSSLAGDGSSTIRIVSKSDIPTTIDLGSLSLSGIGHIETDANIILEIDSLDQLGGARILSGEGTIKAKTGTLPDLSGYIKTSSMHILNADTSEVGGAEVVDTVDSTVSSGHIDGGDGNDYLVGTASSEIITSGNGNDIMLGKAGDDTYRINGTGDKTIIDSFGNDTLDLSEASASATIDLSLGGTISTDTITLGSDSTKQSIDLMLLEDLSGSFEDDVSTVQGLFGNLVTDIQAIQPDTRFGAASFVDKPGYGGAGDDYVYKTEAKLTSDTSLVQDAFDRMILKYGSDIPEAQLEALYQIALRDKADKATTETLSDEIGFRDNAMKVVVIATDASFHQAGEWTDLTPNNGDTVLDSNEDYPTIAAVKEALIETNIYPIFAITDSYYDDNTTTYTNLVAELGRGDVVPLSSDSSDLISSITEGLDNVSVDFLENIIGTNFDDTIIGNSLNNTIDGGAGNDTIVYSNNYSDYTISSYGNTVEVSSFNSGIDTISNVEFLQFADQTVPFVEIATTSISITSDTAGVVGVEENFTYAIDSSSGSVLSQLSSDVTLSGFTVGEDSLTFIDAVNGTTTTASFVDDVIVSSSTINDLTNIIFDENTSGDTYQLILTGIVDSDLSTVDMSVS